MTFLRRRRKTNPNSAPTAEDTFKAVVQALQTSDWFYLEGLLFGDTARFWGSYELTRIVPKLRENSGIFLIRQQAPGQVEVNWNWGHRELPRESWKQLRRMLTDYLEARVSDIRLDHKYPWGI